MAAILKTRKRINLNVIGKSGATTVVASFRTDDKVAGARAKASMIVPIYAKVSE
jgi:redox-regulated HSP33 family molecular chaperone